MTSHSLFVNAPSFPPEILSLIFDETETTSLATVLRCNSTFYSIAYHSLYHDIYSPWTSLRRVKLLKALANASNPAHHPGRLPSPARAVRSIVIDFHSHFATANLLRLINRALKAMQNLRELTLEFSTTSGNALNHIAWCLTGTTFCLRKLDTTIRSDNTFLAWLAHPNQDSLTALTLRGHLLPADSTTPSLPQSALPALGLLRSTYIDNEFNAMFLRGRPVQTVGLTLFPGSSLNRLDMLCRTSMPVRDLRLLCTQQSAEEVVSAIAERLPSIESLYIAVVDTPSADKVLCDLVSSLSRLRCLRTITLMTPDPPGTDAYTTSKERVVVHAWGHACPDLQIVILPLGQAWLRLEGKWYSQPDDFPESETIRAHLAQFSPA